MIKIAHKLIELLPKKWFFTMVPSYVEALDTYNKLSPEFIISRVIKYYHLQHPTFYLLSYLYIDTIFYTAFDTAPLLSETFKVIK